MSDKKQETQKTPKGATIPVPTRKDFFDNLKKASKPEKSPARSPKKKR